MGVAVRRAGAPPTGSWREAVSGLRDNPLYIHLTRAAQRRSQRQDFLRRNAVLIIVVGVGLVIAIYNLYDIATGALPATPWWRAISDPDVLLTSILWVAVLPCAIWLVTGLYCAALDAMSALAAPGRKAAVIVIDDLASMTLLGDKEIVVAVVAASMRRIMWQLFVCSAIAMFVIIYFAYSEQQPFIVNNTYYDNPEDAVNFERAILASGLTFTILVISSSLALLALYSLLMALGRMQQPAVITTAVALMLLSWLVYEVRYSALVIEVVEQYWSTFSEALNGGGLIAFTQWAASYNAFVLSGCLLYLGLSAAKKQLWMSRIIAFLPLPVMALLINAGLLFDYLDYELAFSSSFSSECRELLNNLAWPLGAFVPFNPLAVPLAYSAGYSWHGFITLPWQDLLRYPALYAMQIAMVILCFRFAEQAVRLYRQGCEA